MALVVETGSGLSDAESYISVADATSYLAEYAADKDGVAPASWTGAASDAVRENALRQATQWIDRKFEGKWQGTSATATQRLTHPLYGVQINGYSWDSAVSGLPRALTEACAEVALLFIGGEALFENHETSGPLVSESIKIGPLAFSEKYASGRSEDDVYTKVEALLSRLLDDTDLVIRG